MIPLFLIDEVRLVCRKMLNIFGEHVVHCKKFLGFKYIHDFVRDVLFDIFRREEVSVKKETPMNFLTYSLYRRLTLTYVDVMVYRWVGGKQTCVDLTGVSSNVRLMVRAFMVRHAAIKVASNKMVKFEKTCFDNQNAFKSFAFDTFGFLT
ncbi:hypothetical protein MtrunA17_Chr8g0389551 [Medicago truncatula]|uniref:Uncharacterized protein n=1 Tax=Medicago truncatula TaxID=3880 RepID=A0A396GQZ7_MEDTR|nr:hypothetical protein MtrunA17_Chr8g0389551 [Medicago truncatula]